MTTSGALLGFGLVALLLTITPGLDTALVLRAGNVVTPSELADAVWSDEPPSTWPIGPA